MRSADQPAPSEFGGVALGPVSNSNLRRRTAVPTNGQLAELFKKYLQSDFIEGTMLADIVKDQPITPRDDATLTYKRMYLAFLRKFHLGKAENPSPSLHLLAKPTPPHSFFCGPRRQTSRLHRSSWRALRRNGVELRS
mmetsp:Transcript_12466/g.35691  ORF Transcript_12466/g.35691 Transcript_12466/m.35691 type:complete len:138 (-) Transcript_12466:629-1042(-)